MKNELNNTFSENTLYQVLHDKLEELTKNGHLNNVNQFSPGGTIHELH